MHTGRVRHRRVPVLILVGCRTPAAARQDDTVGSRFNDADYQLRWPRGLFVQEASRLLNNRNRNEWDEVCEQFLEDAFVGGGDGGPLSEFREFQPASSDAPWGAAAGTTRSGTTTQLTEKQNFLRKLMQSADRLIEVTARRKPYWSQRTKGAPTQLVRQAATARQFVAVVSELDDRGYFEKRFGKDCVDDPSEVDPSTLIEREIGVGGLWPLQADRLVTDLDLFCDVVEVLHDLVARPEMRSLHPYAGCGWHHSHFSIENGRTIYRWRVNQLLEHSEVGLRLADDGEDVGRMVAPTDDARNELVEVMLSHDDGEVGDQVRHATALFRARGAEKHQKRSAIVVLCNVLEERRKLIHSELMSKDEDALFMIANTFSLRHQNERQRSDYDPVFLDWLFWWYLATIELTDHIADRAN